MSFAEDVKNELCAYEPETDTDVAMKIEASCLLRMGGSLLLGICLLNTSDAADEEDCVDGGGVGIIIPTDDVYSISVTVTTNRIGVIYVSGVLLRKTEDN